MLLSQIFIENECDKVAGWVAPTAVGHTQIFVIFDSFDRLPLVRCSLRLYGNDIDYISFDLFTQLDVIVTNGCDRE